LEALKNLSFGRFSSFQFAGMNITPPLDGGLRASTRQDQFPAIHSLIEQGQLHLIDPGADCPNIDTLQPVRSLPKGDRV